MTVYYNIYSFSGPGIKYTYNYVKSGRRYPEKKTSIASHDDQFSRHTSVKSKGEKYTYEDMVANTNDHEPPTEEYVEMIPTTNSEDTQSLAQEYEVPVIAYL